MLLFYLVYGIKSSKHGSDYTSVSMLPEYIRRTSPTKRMHPVVMIFFLDNTPSCNDIMQKSTDIIRTAALISFGPSYCLGASHSKS